MVSEKDNGFTEEYLRLKKKIIEVNGEMQDTTGEEYIELLKKREQLFKQLNKEVLRCK